VKLRALGLVFLTVILIGAIGTTPGLPISHTMTHETGSPLTRESRDNIPESLYPMVEQAIAEDNPYLPSDYDIGSVLGDRDNNYKVINEPWKSKAAIHAMAYDEATGFLALGGGYLYDNEVHLFRHNVETNQFDKVWDTGDGIFQSDVMSLDFGDTDLNDFLEIVAGCADGHVYVFEQRHIYDPYANTENQFDHVWTSPNMFRAFAVKVDDIDRDYRADIIAGGWDGKVHIFEYDNHSGYPFVEEHWITYDEVATLDIGEKVYSLETGDTNNNGLPEIIVGTREGTVYVYENDGITLYVNGHPFPLIYDNHYYLNWTSQNYTWTPILSMSAGELDGDSGDEIALVAQGQGVFTLDWDPVRKTYAYEKVYRSYREWETFGLWGLDFYADSVVEAWNVTYNDPLNASISVPEPIQYTWGGSYFIPDASVYPYNTGMATYPDGNYSTFDASDPSVDNATAIIDFGLDEEGTGSANDNPDVWIGFKNFFIVGADISHAFNFSVSRDGTDFEQVSSDCWTYSGKYLKVDVDSALGKRKWDYFRYAKISVYNGSKYDIGSLELQQVWNTVTEALSVEIGPIKEDGDLWHDGGSELDKVLVATSIGELLGVKYNSSTGEYDLFWESGDDDYYKFGAGIWDMVNVNTESDIPAWNLWTGINFDPDAGYIANQWSSGTIDPYYEQIFNMFLAQYPEAGGTPKIVAHSYDGAVDSATTALLAAMNNDFDDQEFLFDKVSVEPAYMFDEYLNPTGYPILAVGGINEDIPIDAMTYLYRAQILFYYRASYMDDFVNYEPLWRMDVNGQLTSQINLAKTTPKLDFADYDGDGDQDFVVSNGYIYMAKNLKLGEDATGQLNFTLDNGYFDTINNLDTSAIWGQPDLHDLDGDGDFDLVMSYDSKNGSTVFINDGTAEDPIWVEHKKIMSNPGVTTNLKLLNITDVRMVQDWGSYYDGLYLERLLELTGEERPDYYLYGYNTYTTGVWMAEPVFGSADSYIVASYPRVARINLNLMEGSYSKFFNLGYHVMEDWNNDDDLEEWTLSVTTADTDNDGNNEIIVGDYDNNVYAFEHLVNNTYKRMFRSFDLNHSEVTDESPYAYEDLEGISGDFNRRIWDHARHLVADVDLDHDGLKEIIVAAHLQIYIFEEVGFYGGDAVRFVYSFDLRNTEWGDDSQFLNHVTEISAMAAGNDLDSDGRGDLVVAAGPYLFIYNVDQESFISMEDNDYFVTSAGMEGRYYLIGNPRILDYKYVRINAVAVGDTDKDGYREVIIAGIRDVRLMRENGFLNIYECRGGTFYKSWSAPSEVTYWNPISVLKIDDQDYDGEPEIIMGHKYGFDMWEHAAGVDNAYVKVEHVTASPNYPNVPLQTTYRSGDNFVLSNRSQKSIAHLRHSSVDDIITMLFENNNDIYSKRYNTTTGQWAAMGDLSLPYPGATTISYESEPHCSAWGDRIYITWNGRASNGSTYIFVTYYDYGDASYGPGINVPRDIFEFGYRHSPSVFQYNSTHIGVAYVLDYAFLGFQSWTVNIKLLDNDLTGNWESVYHSLENEVALIVHDAEVIRLDDGRFAMAMAATNPSIYKSDHDIWVAVGNSTLSFDGIYAHQATTSFYDELYVDIDELNTEDKSLVVLYERIGAPVEDRFGMIASQNDGATWNVEGYLNTIPDYVDRLEMPGGYVEYRIGGLVLNQLETIAPAFMARDDGGFIYAGTFMRWIPLYIFLGNDQYGWVRGPDLDIVYGINPQSDWALNHLHDVVDLDVGDSDGDGRREVAVAFENQYAIYELDSSNIGGGVMYYLEDFLSNELENPVTGIAISDSNGNGWDDIALSCERGDVFFFEYIDVSEGIRPLRGSMVNFTATASGYGNFAGYESFMSYDLDSDDKEEIIIAPYSGSNVTAYDDDGTVLWNFNDSSSGFRNMLLEDINNDTIPEVLLGGRDGFFWVLHINNGTKAWMYDTAGADVYCMDVEDIDSDGSVEIAVGTKADDVIILHSNGSVFYDWALGAGDVRQMVFGNFTGASHLDLALVTGTAISVMNPLNGTIFYQTGSNTVAAGPNLRIADLNDDGLDDLVFARYGLHILDVSTGSVFYNSTEYSDTAYLLDVWIDDFDGDDALEIASFHVGAEIHLEDITSGSTQWIYSPDEDFFAFDAQVGHYGGSGELDIVVGLSNSSTDGITVVLDGKNGIPMWFNRSGGIPYTMGSADIHGKGMDTAFAWDFATSQIVGMDSYKRVLPEEEDAYPMHELYWNLTITNVSVGGTLVADVNSDSIDEIIMWDTNKTIWLLNGSNGAVIWAVQLPAEISDISVGNLDGSSWLDLAVQGKDHKVYAVTGTSGSISGTVSAPTSWKVLDCYVGEFDSGHSNNEMAIGFIDGSEAFVGWYDESGSELYRTSQNASGDVRAMAVGHVLGLSTLDVVIGGGNEFAEVFRGSDGLWQWLYWTGGPTVYEIQVGNLTGDAYADLAIEDSSADVRIVDGSSHNLITTLVTTTPLRDYKLADLYLDDGKQEIVLSEQNYGVRAFDSGGILRWQYVAPLTSGSSRFTCDDMNGDGHTDLIVTNKEYLSVIDGTSSELLWHFSSLGDAILSPLTGQFIDPTYPPDILSYSGANVYVISGTENPPLPPPIPAAAEVSPNFWTSEKVLASLSSVVPIIGCIALVGFVIKKRKEEE
jgi:hypothetical protein